MALPTIEPDSGRAWLVAVAAAAANGAAFGTAYTFGTFFDSMADEFGSDSGSTALLFGVTLLFFFGMGIVTGPIADRVGYHRLLAIGGTMFVAGLWATANVDSLTLGYLTYGLGVGVGSGCFIAPLTALVGLVFVRRRAIALGVLAAGNGVGTLILSPLSRRLIDDQDWRHGYSVLAAIGAVVFLLAWPAVRGRPATPAAAVAPSPALVGHGDGNDFAFVRTPGFLSLATTGLLMSVGLFVAFAFVVPFAKDEGISASGASRLVAIIGLSSIVGRLGLTGAVDRLGSVRVYQLALAIQPVAYVIWLVAGGDYTLLVLFAVVLGVSYGGFVAVGPAVVLDLFGVANIGRKMGALFLMTGLGGFIGPPTAGYVADATSGRAAPILLVIALLVVALAASWPLGRMTASLSRRPSAAA